LAHYGYVTAEKFVYWKKTLPLRYITPIVFCSPTQIFAFVNSDEISSRLVGGVIENKLNNVYTKKNF
jgi:hypothetical protein